MSLSSHMITFFGKIQPLMKIEKNKLNLCGIATQFRYYFNQPVYWSIQFRVKVRVSLLILISG